MPIYGSPDMFQCILCILVLGWLTFISVSSRLHVDLHIFTNEIVNLYGFESVSPPQLAEVYSEKRQFWNLFCWTKQISEPSFCFMQLWLKTKCTKIYDITVYRDEKKKKKKKKKKKIFLTIWYTDCANHHLFAFMPRWNKKEFRSRIRWLISQIHFD